MASKIDPPPPKVDEEAQGREALAQDTRELLVMAKMDASPQTLHLSGHDYVVKKLTVRQIGPFLSAVSEAIPFILQSIASDGEIKLGLLVDTGVAEAVAHGCAIITGQAIDHILDLPADEFMVLTAKVLTVNMDFFFHRLPEISGLLANAVLKAAQVVDQKIKDGGASSSDFSPTGTASTM